MGDADWQQIESAASASGEVVVDFIRRVLLKAARTKNNASKKVDLWSDGE
jgi:hypothetical protein